MSIVRYSYPKSFDPSSFPSTQLFACVLAEADGAILAVRLPQRIRGGATDRELIATIRTEWRFYGFGGGNAGWERVLLNNRPASYEPMDIE